MILVYGVWVLILGFGFWVLIYGFRVLVFDFLVFAFWFLVFGLGLGLRLFVSLVSSFVAFCFSCLVIVLPPSL